MAGSLWIVYALSASVLWGIGYVLSEKILKETAISPAFLMLASQIICIPLYIGLCYYLGQIKTGIGALFSSQAIFWLVAVHAATLVIGNFLILNSVVEKNATLATLIEITYPLFVALFAFLILKEAQLNWGTAFGGALVFIGVITIYLKS